MQSELIYEIFDKINKEYFAGKLPYIRIIWSESFGHGKYFHMYGDFIALPNKRPYIRLSKKLCDEPHKIAQVLYHEMVHFWLYTNKKPWGHTREFRKKLKEYRAKSGS